MGKAVEAVGSSAARGMSRGAGFNLEESGGKRSEYRAVDCEILYWNRECL